MAPNNNKKEKSMEGILLPYNSVLCGERMARLKDDIDNGLISIRAELTNCKDGINAKIEAERKLAASINEGKQRAMGEALDRIDKYHEDYDNRLKIFEEDKPKHLINRLNTLEGWRKYILGMGAVAGLYGFLLWKYVTHITIEHDKIIQTFTGTLNKFLEYIR